MTACPPPASEGEGEGEGCALSPLARDLLEQSVSELFVDAAFSTTTTHGGDFIDLGFGADLVGLDVGVLQNASLVFPCTEATTFEPTCETTLSPEPLEDPFFDEHDRCFRLGCVGADQPFVDAYYTMTPNTAADARHAFTVTTTTPAGTSTYAQNPLWRWIADLRVAGTVGIHADVDVEHVFEAGDEIVDVSHSGVVDGTAVEADPDDLVTVDMTLSFPEIADEAVVVEVHADDQAVLSGAITLGGATLATLAGDVDLGAPLPFAWIAECE